MEMKFKFNAETLKVLKNFSMINNSIIFNPGNVLKTLSNSNDIFANVEIDQEIPKEFSIYDLNVFLSMLSCMEDSELNLGDNSLQIESSSGSFELFYPEKTLISAPPETSPTVIEYYSFDLTADMLSMILKAASITRAQSLTFKTVKGMVKMMVNDRKNSTSSSFKRDIGEVEEGLTFDLNVNVERLKVIITDYVASISTTKSGKNSILYLKSKDGKIQYCIACELDSVVTNDR